MYRSGNDLLSAKISAFYWSPLKNIHLMNTLASLLNLGGPDVLIIALIVVLLFGAKRLPQLARSMGQSLREFSKGKDGPPADNDDDNHGAPRG
jgi:sec-independent protein translocase protein TatA